jgi:protein arginine kinase
VQQPFWLQGNEGAHDVVLSTRYRLARNLRGFPFPARSNWQVRQQVAALVRRAVEHEFPLWKVLESQDLTPLVREVLFEKHLISAHLKNHPEGALIVLSREARFAILVNEEDHLRFQFLLPGFQLAGAWKEIMDIESRLERWLGFAFHQQYGYLTSCLTNVGTGLRASVMLHLPALSWAGSLTSTLSLWPDQAIEFRGMFGEGSSLGEGFVQLSNKITLGADIPALNSQVLASAEELVSLERRARQDMLEHYSIKLEDSVQRALATLLSARLMSSAEATMHLSTVRLGACLGVLPRFPTRDLLRLLVETRPAHLQLQAGRFLEFAERDEWRATHIRSQIGALVEDKHDG